MHCEPADSFASVKAKAGKLMGIEQGQIGLFATRDKARELVDLATIGDQEISNDQVLYVVKRSGTTVGSDTKCPLKRLSVCLSVYALPGGIRV
ncbi:unnamed protein product [Laminaria digitata]